MPVKKQTNKPVRKSVQRKTTVARAGSKAVPMSFGGAVRSFFKKYCQFNGVATRAEFWWAFLFVILGALGAILLGILFAFIIAAATQPGDTGTALWAKILVGLPGLLFGVATIIPMYAVMARRLHDAGFTAKLLFVNIFLGALGAIVASKVAYVDWVSRAWTIFVYVLLLFPSKKQNNPYRD